MSRMTKALHDLLGDGAAAQVDHIAMPPHGAHRAQKDAERGGLMPPVEPGEAPMNINTAIANTSGREQAQAKV